MIDGFNFRLKGLQAEFFSLLANMLFTDPNDGVFTANKIMGAYPNGGGPDVYNFEAAIRPTRLEVTIPIQELQKKDPALRDWMNQFHSGLEAKRGIQMVPVVNNCEVRIHYQNDGIASYYLWYPCRNADGVLLTGMPMGELVAKEPY